MPPDRTPQRRGEPIELPPFPEEDPRFLRLVELVERYDPALGLTASLEELRHRHIPESILLAGLLQAHSPPRRWIDLGSGNGVPGAVVALASGVTVELWERRARRCHFLEILLNALDLGDSKVRNCDVSSEPPLDTPATLMAKALMPPEELVRAAERLLPAGGSLWSFSSEEPEEAFPAIIASRRSLTSFPCAREGELCGWIWRVEFDAQDRDRQPEGRSG